MMSGGEGQQQTLDGGAYGSITRDKLQPAEASAFRSLTRAAWRSPVEFGPLPFEASEPLG